MDQDGGAGGDISLSIDETNKLRISLGLKPLRLDSQPSQAEKERQNHDAKKREEAEAQAAELRRKIEESREKRLMEAKLRSVKTLGAEDDDDDSDMAAWVEKNRKLEQQRREEAARKAAAAKAATKSKRKHRHDSDEEEGAYKSSELQGLKVRHDLGEVGEGETVIVTLADKPLLDERGELRDEEDELENTLLAEETRRRKALKASKKEAKPLWEEDGKVRTLLDKYDEEEEEVVVQLGAGGRLEADRLRRQEDMRKKLSEGTALLAGSGADGAGLSSGPAPAGGDYYTAAEMAAFNKSKKKKAKGARRLRVKSEEPELGDTAEFLATLEAQAEEAGAAAGSDLGRRTDRGAASARAEAAAKAAAADKRARFEAAVQKANWASQFLRPTKGGGGGGASTAAAAVGVDDDEADRELRDSLERARRLAQKKKDEEAAAAARVKQEEGAAGGEEGGEGGSGRGREAGSVEEVARLAAARRQADSKAGGKAGIGAMFSHIGMVKEVLTETMEFVRNITAQPVIPKPRLEGNTSAGPPAGAASEPGLRSAGGGAMSVGRGSTPSAGRRTPGYSDGGGSDLDVDVRMDSGGEEDEDGERAGVRTGTWVTAEEMEAEAAGGEGDAGGSKGPRGGARGRGRGAREGSAGPSGGGGGSGRDRTEVEAMDAGITGERAVGRGLAGALGLLNDKGALKQQVEWSGRNNDKSKNALQGLDDVFTGGRNEDRVARSVEAALTVRDKYGRVLTPKERFRQICYSFHGIKPSKNKIDKQTQRDTEELAIKKAATTEDPSAELDRLRAVQRVTGSAYVVLSGKNVGLPAAVASGAVGAIGNSDDEDDILERRRRPAKAATGSSSLPPPEGPLHPMSGVRGGGGGVGNLTPLLGDRKVEAMLGIRKPPKGPGKH